MSSDTDSQSIAWLVESRNRIQSVMLRLLYAPTDKPETQLYVGAAFSLWRAVFLAHATDLHGRRSPDSTIGSHASQFLRRVVETNTVTFSDDLRARIWSGGYYINNARYRLSLSPDAGGQPLSELWDETFRVLEDRLSAVFDH